MLLWNKVFFKKNYADTSAVGKKVSVISFRMKQDPFLADKARCIERNAYGTCTVPVRAVRVPFSLSPPPKGKMMKWDYIRSRKKNIPQNNE